MRQSPRPARGTAEAPTVPQTSSTVIEHATTRVLCHKVDPGLELDTSDHLNVGSLSLYEDRVLSMAAVRLDYVQQGEHVFALAATAEQEGNVDKASSLYFLAFGLLLIHCSTTKNPGKRVEQLMEKYVIPSIVL